VTEIDAELQRQAIGQLRNRTSNRPASRPRARADGSILSGLVRCPRRFDVRFASWRSPDAGARVDLGHAVRRGPRERRAALRAANRLRRKNVAYSGDTEWTDSLVDARAGADLFIARRCFFDKAVKYHLNLATLLATVPSSSAGASS